MKKFLICLGILCGMASQVYAKQDAPAAKEPQLRICLSNGYLPYTMKSPDSTWDGFDVAIIRDFAKHIHRQPQFIEVQWASIIPTLQAGKCDLIVGVIITEERKKAVDFGNVTYENTLSIAIRKEDKKLFPHSDDFMATQKQLGVTSGTSSALFAQKNYKYIKIYDGFDTPIDALISKKVDGVLFETNYFLSMPPETRKKIIVLTPPVEKEDVSEAFKKGDTKLINQYNAWLAEWLKTDKLKTYQAKYFTHSSKTDSK